METNIRSSNNPKKVLVAGATGYLGRYVVKAFKEKGYYVRALARNEEKAESIREYIDEVWIGEITDPSRIRGICEGMEYVFSSVGITRQKEGLTYMDVDYQGNMNLMEEAKKARVKGFMYISVFNAESLGKLKIVAAKEKFVSALKSSGLTYVIVRPNGFFSDMTEFFNMAKKGKVLLFGNGEYVANPIGGEDLANFCAEEISGTNLELDVGGPEHLTQNNIARQAFYALEVTPRLSHIPEWVAKLTVFFMRLCTSSKVYGPVEFFMNVMTMDMAAPLYGNHTLGSYFRSLADSAPRNNE
jgi:uncharacterized protein YbjT (DUF2867 family)